jgi:N-acyl-D-amino-acid deacylase
MLLLHGGTIIDGTGSPRRQGDLAIEGDRIVAVDHIAGHSDATRIDCSGLIVAPGFIDVHNHSDGWLLKLGRLESKIAQGFTTEVLMSDGISYAPVSQETAPHWLYYLRSLNGLEQADYRGWRSIADYMSLLNGRMAQNAIAQIPYANVRALHVGWGREPADDAQIRRMQHDVRQAMHEGACGISTGLDYVAQCFVRTDELAEVCSAMRDSGGLYVTHVRYKKGVLAGVQEAVEIGRRAGVPVHVSHLKAAAPRDIEALLDYIDRVAVKEVDFTFDVYPYLPGSTMLNMLLPYEVWEDGPLGVLARLADPTIRRRFAVQLADYQTELDHVRLAWTCGTSNRPHHGRSLADYCQQSGKPVADALCDLLIDENLAALGVFHIGDDRLVEPFLAHPKFMLGSDGIFFADGTVHPRQYGSAPRILGPIVRDRRLFTLEEAVRKMSGFPAERFGLRDRGVIRAGAFADVVVFDAATIADRATFEQPHQLAVGIKQVLVNGRSVLSDGQFVEMARQEMPGRALRFKCV